jgi:hypothetical protein
MNDLDDHLYPLGSFPRSCVLHYLRLDMLDDWLACWTLSLVMTRLAPSVKIDVHNDEISTVYNRERLRLWCALKTMFDT